MIESIYKIIFDTSFKEDFIDLVIKRLTSFGYIPTEKDIFNIGFSIQNVDKSIKREINSTIIPEGLLNTAIDLVCGEVFFILKNSNQLDENFNIEKGLKTIQAGDTTVTYSDNFLNNEQRLDFLINYLRKREKEIIRYRRVSW